MKLIRGLVLPLLLLFSLPTPASGTSTPGDEPSSVGVALGSGGAGGLAHIAILRVFDEQGRRPDALAGSSIGAVIGALYASGLSADEIYDIFDDFAGSELDALSQLMRPSSDLTLRDLLKLDFGDGGLIDPDGFLEFLAGKMEARRFDDLSIPLEVVATDYWTGEMVVLDEGELFPAIKASMAVPGLFPPVRRGEQLLIDGGTSNPLPFDLLTGRYDMVVAVDVSGARRRGEQDEAGLTDLLFSTFEIMQQSLIAAQMRYGQPDIYLKPDTSDVRLLHFHKIDLILEQAAPEAEALREALLQAP
ncbi:NTE family protein [Alkalispirillum mobile]|uniref:NTE family protein n=1 Tax=Alkalispirillum mobile TaxID=85925 RepID=A0A498C8S5_9GAMM|nr:patatin-like phospholipase family protein [Alkalispirillum mobile]RLK50606.1 NTE family protein [Alkalispirillum mobile]